MNNKKFKVGDRVRIINCCTIESYELNKVGIIVDIAVYDDDRTYYSYVVDMGRKRRPESDCDNETCWWLNEKCIELVLQKNEQLLFEFMYK